MGLVFKTRRSIKPQQIGLLAARVATPRSTGDVLGPIGTKAARDAAQADLSLRNSNLVTNALRHRTGLPARTFALLEAGTIGTSLVDPFAEPADPRLLEKFSARLCLKHRVLPWRSISGRVTVLATNREHFLRVRDALTIIFGATNSS